MHTHLCWTLTLHTDSHTPASTHVHIHKSRHRIDCLCGPEPSSLHESTSFDEGLFSSSLREESISLPIELGHGHGTCSGQWNVNRHDASRSWRTACAILLFSFDPCLYCENMLRMLEDKTHDVEPGCPICPTLGYPIADRSWWTIITMGN